MTSNVATIDGIHLLAAHTDVADIVVLQRRPIRPSRATTDAPLDESDAPAKFTAAAVAIAELGLADSDLARVNRYLDATRSSMLFGPRVLLVEGIAEALLIPAFARAMFTGRTGLADFHLVSDEQIRAAQQLLASHAHTLAEGAGAAALAAAPAHPDEFAGQHIAVVCTGGNSSTAEIAALGG